MRSQRSESSITTTEIRPLLVDEFNPAGGRRRRRGRARPLGVGVRLRLRRGVSHVSASPVPQ